MLKLISTSTCAACKMVKLQFDAHNIKYEEIDYYDLDKDVQDSILEKARESGLISFPIIIKEGDILKSDDILGGVV